MKFIKALGLAFALSSAFGSAALASQDMTAEDAAARGCFYGPRADRFTVIASDVMQVRAGFDYYNLTMRFCPQLRWADRVAFDSFGSWVCDGDHVLLYDFRGRLIDRCWIDDVSVASNRRRRP